jgi:hypothetical protein
MNLWLAKEGINGTYLLMRDTEPPVWRLVSGLKGRKNTMTCCGYGNTLFWIRNISSCFPLFHIKFYGQKLLCIDKHADNYSITSIKEEALHEEKSIKRFYLCKDSSFGMYCILDQCSNSCNISVTNNDYFTTSRIENLFPSFKIKEPSGIKCLEITPIENGYQIREVKNEPNK